MPTSVLKCENCGGQKPFFMHEAELQEFDASKPIERHCPTCRTMTTWILVFAERRSGRERRNSSERREPD